MANSLTKVIMKNIATKSLKREDHKEQTSISLQQKEEMLLINLIHKNRKVENQRDKGSSTIKKEKPLAMTLSELAATTSRLQKEEKEENKGILFEGISKKKTAIENRSITKLESYAKFTSLQAMSEKSSEK